MKHPVPPPLSKQKQSFIDPWSRLLIRLAVVVGVLMAALGGLRVAGLICPFSMPTGSMEPAILPGDHMMMEGFTFLARKPRRGDLAVFKTDGIPGLPPATTYVKRIAGEPGDHLRISDGKLYINDKQVALSNKAGEIVYLLPVGAEAMSPQTDVMVPDGHYYVLGDNSTNSSDSRFWGCVPASNIKGRMAFCYWPLRRFGNAK
jgi:signal peptidase I